MIRRQHILYDLHQQVTSVKLLVIVLIIGAFFVLFIDLNFVYLFALILAGLFALRGLIGRRCPLCDGPLREEGAERDKENAFVMYITWRCPRDGYEEKETTKGDAGLFGVN